MQNHKPLILLALFTFFFVSITSAQVVDTLYRPVDTSRKAPIKAVRMDTTKRKVDTLKTKYENPGKIAGRRAVFKSLTIPGWGQLYNNQLLVDDLNSKGETTGHFWQKTYTLSKVGIIYAGFTLLTLSYIDNSKGYRIFLEEARVRELNKNIRPPATKYDVNPDLVQYSDNGVIGAKDTYKRNRQIIIFSYVAVYAVNVIDAYVAARLHYFNIDDQLSFKITPTLINNSANMYSFNPAAGLKLSLTF